jgi:hypothetical protein
MIAISAPPQRGDGDGDVKTRKKGKAKKRPRAPEKKSCNRALVDDGQKLCFLAW